jgi:uncharacterized protein (DUF1800 family)
LKLFSAFSDPLKLRCRLIVFGLAILMFGCSPQENDSRSFGSTGQVSAVASNGQVTYYAAARFAEQATMGPSPEAIKEIQRLGFEAWIDKQLALPPSMLPLIPRDDRRDKDKYLMQTAFLNMAIGAEDQLRVKMTWSLSQFLTVSILRISGTAGVGWANGLQAYSLTNYRTILDFVTTSPAMGWFLDNSLNRPKSEQCPWCEPNENFARELMELFSIGTVKLSSDGSFLRDARGAKIPAYGQTDVDNMARALTGWTYVQDDVYGDEWTNWAKPMVPDKESYAHDWREKNVLGKQIPANQDQAKDLKSVLDILMNHENIAPFVAKRLIQHFVKSNPSPEYISRVSAKFRNNGDGLAGDMKAVIKAVLLDTEARRGDKPSTMNIVDGKYKEPLLFDTHLWRSLSCKTFPANIEGRADYTNEQQPFAAETVFSFYSPSGIASGTSLPAPEQLLVNVNELRRRTIFLKVVGTNFTNIISNDDANRGSINRAGCKLEEISALLDRNPEGFLDEIALRFFRGALPTVLRQELKDYMAQYAGDPFTRARTLIQFALLYPEYGVIK